MKPIAENLYLFDLYRKKFKLSAQKTGFFQPFESSKDVQTQIKTIMMSPVIGAYSVALSTLSLLTNIVNMGIGVICLDPTLCINSLEGGLGNIVGGIVTPLVACIVTIAAAASLLTRSIATLLDMNGEPFCYDSLSSSFLNSLPNNPFAKMCFS